MSEVQEALESGTGDRGELIERKLFLQFLYSMLNEDPRKRFNAAELLESEFFQQYCSSGADSGHGSYDTDMGSIHEEEEDTEEEDEPERMEVVEEARDQGYSDEARSVPVGGTKTAKKKRRRISLKGVRKFFSNKGRSSRPLSRTSASSNSRSSLRRLSDVSLQAVQGIRKLSFRKSKRQSVAPEQSDV